MSCKEDLGGGEWEVAQQSVMWLKMTLNFCLSHLHFSSAGITGMGPMYATKQILFGSLFLEDRYIFSNGINT